MQKVPCVASRRERIWRTARNAVKTEAHRRMDLGLLTGLCWEKDLFPAFSLWKSGPPRCRSAGDALLQYSAIYLHMYFRLWRWAGGLRRAVYPPARWTLASRREDLNWRPGCTFSRLRSRNKWHHPFYERFSYSSDQHNKRFRVCIDPN